MRSQISRSVERTGADLQYRLVARLYPTPIELQLMQQYHLDRIEVFVDPHRQHLDNAAESAHEQARSLGLFTTSARKAASVCAAETRAVWYARQALRVFRITVGHLLEGVHRDR